MKTIKELADELGVSKTAIRKHMNEDFRAAHTENLPGNVIGIDEDGCKLIAESLRKPPETRVRRTKWPSCGSSFGRRIARSKPSRSRSPS